MDCDSLFRTSLNKIMDYDESKLKVFMADIGTLLRSEMADDFYSLTDFIRHHLTQELFEVKPSIYEAMERMLIHVLNIVTDVPLPCILELIGEETKDRPFCSLLRFARVMLRESGLSREPYVEYILDSILVFLSKPAFKGEYQIRGIFKDVLYMIYKEIVFFYQDFLGKTVSTSENLALGTFCLGLLNGPISHQYFYDCPKLEGLRVRIAEDITNFYVVGSTSILIPDDKIEEGIEKIQREMERKNPLKIPYRYDLEYIREIWGTHSVEKFPNLFKNRRQLRLSIDIACMEKRGISKDKAKKQIALFYATVVRTAPFTRYFPPIYDAKYLFRYLLRCCNKYSSSSSQVRRIPVPQAMFDLAFVLLNSGLEFDVSELAFKEHRKFLKFAGYWSEYSNNEGIRRKALLLFQHYRLLFQPEARFLLDINLGSLKQNPSLEAEWIKVYNFEWRQEFRGKTLSAWKKGRHLYSALTVFSSLLDWNEHILYFKEKILALCGLFTVIYSNDVQSVTGWKKFALHFGKNLFDKIKMKLDEEKIHIARREVRLELEGEKFVEDMNKQEREWRKEGLIEELDDPQDIPHTKEEVAKNMKLSAYSASILSDAVDRVKKYITDLDAEDK